jgi:hypothetical protein
MQHVLKIQYISLSPLPLGNGDKEMYWILPLGKYIQ